MNELNQDMGLVSYDQKVGALRAKEVISKVIDNFNNLKQRFEVLGYGKL